MERPHGTRGDTQGLSDDLMRRGKEARVRLPVSGGLRVKQSLLIKREFLSAF